MRRRTSLARLGFASACAALTLWLAGVDRVDASAMEDQLPEIRVSASSGGEPAVAPSATPTDLVLDPTTGLLVPARMFPRARRAHPSGNRARADDSALVFDPGLGIFVERATYRTVHRARRRIAIHSDHQFVIDPETGLLIPSRLFVVQSDRPAPASSRCTTSTAMRIDPDTGLMVPCTLEGP